jgi:hypothetical protein
VGVAAVAGACDSGGVACEHAANTDTTNIKKNRRIRTSERRTEKAFAVGRIEP